jgi:hypothetical protein
MATSSNIRKTSYSMISQPDILVTGEEKQDICNLFQFRITDDILDNWEPLNATCISPENCVPTTLRLLDLINDEYANQLSLEVERTAMSADRIIEIVKDIATNIGTIRDIEGIGPMNIDYLNNIRDRLIPGYGTIIALEKVINRRRKGHFTILAKRLDNSVVFIEGQTSQIFELRDRFFYLHSNWQHFYFFCYKSFKREREDESRYIRNIRKIDEQPKKRPREDIGGTYKKKTKTNKYKNYKKKTNKYKNYKKKTKTNKYNNYKKKTKTNKYNNYKKKTKTNKYN